MIEKQRSTLDLGSDCIHLEMGLLCGNNRYKSHKRGILRTTNK